MRRWAMVLHFYQPSTQDPKITQNILHTSYLPIVQLLQKYPRARLTINLTGSLLMQLLEPFGATFISLVSDLVKKGQIELLNSPMYHPMIPLSPKDLVQRQLVKNREVTRKILGINPGGGVYPPELAVDEDTIQLLSKQAQYILVDESCINLQFSQELICDKPVVKWKHNNLVVNSRSICEILRSYPGRLEANKLIEFILKQTKPDQIIVSVTDAELFGHHYEERLELLEEIFNSSAIELVTVDQIINGKIEELVGIIPSSWQLWPGQSTESRLYLWSDPQNELQQKYLSLAVLAYELFSQAINDSNVNLIKSAEEHLDQGWSSCYFYWLSNDPWWHPDLAIAGALHLIRCIRALPISNEHKRTGEHLYHDLLQSIWMYHWSDKVEKNYRVFEAKRAKFIQDLPSLDRR